MKPIPMWRRFDRLFTFGANIGTPASPVPVGDFTWLKTWQPVTMDDWCATAFTYCSEVQAVPRVGDEVNE